MLLRLFDFLVSSKIEFEVSYYKGTVVTIGFSSREEEIKIRNYLEENPCKFTFDTPYKIQNIGTVNIYIP